MKPRREVGAAPVDPDEGDLAAGVLLDDLVRDPHERAPDVVLVEDDLWVRHSGSFLASPGRVKGTRENLAAEADDPARRDSRRAARRRPFAVVPLCALPDA